MPTAPLVPAPAAVPQVERQTLPPAPARFQFEGAIRQGGVVIGTAPEGVVAVNLNGEKITLAPDRRFLIAFDRDAPPTARISATLSDGRSIDETLTVAKGDWEIEHVDASRTGGRTSAEFRRLRPAELAAINGARARETGAEGWRQQFTWPVIGRISGRFGAQRIYRGTPGSYHSGVDVAKPAGTPLVAPADGVVILATDHPFTLEGNLLMIDHGMGLNSAFLHLSEISVREGESVRRGQPIGRIGATGRATGPHMHWGMKWNDARIDPLLLAGPMPSRS
ncbi:M23 family peptidase [Sphingomonas gilva]|uniref:M23 family peptidase n=1 Tax=Sphingomonas gilva TaxID=2305907 RepID=A0A396RVI1_9SPHN|nr:M23 family peptidase [Sphingomonas gilva]